MTSCKLFLNISIKCTLFKISHLVFFMSNELMARINISIRCNRNILISTAASTKSFYYTRSLVKVYHKVEEINKSTVFLYICNLINKLVIFFINLVKVFFGNRILNTLIFHNRLNRNLVKTLFIRCITSSEKSRL